MTARLGGIRRMIVAAFLLDFSVAIGLTAMPFFTVDRLHGGTALSGTIGAAQMAVYAAGCLLTSWFGSRMRGGLRWAVAGAGIYVALFVLVPWVHTPAVCVVVASAPFLGLALAWPAMQTWLGTEPDPEARARYLAGFNIATAFGFTLSPLLAGPLYDRDFRLPFVALFILGSLVIFLILSLLRDSGVAPLDQHEDAPAKDASTQRVSNGLLYASWAATFTANGLFAAVRSVYPVRVEALASSGTLVLFGEFRPAQLDAVGPATTYSWLAFLLSLATVICFAILGRTQAWQERFSIVIGGQLAAAASLALLGHTRSLVVMILCFVVVGANFGLCFFASLYYSLAVAEQRRGRVAMNEGALGAGGFAGGIGLGYAAESFGVPVTFMWAPLAVVFAIAAQVLLLRGPRDSSRELPHGAGTDTGDTPRI